MKNVCYSDFLSWIEINKSEIKVENVGEPFDSDFDQWKDKIKDYVFNKKITRKEFDNINLDRVEGESFDEQYLYLLKIIVDWKFSAKVNEWTMIHVYLN